jgi:hypothetical protein
VTSHRLELTRYSWLKAILKSRLFQPTLMLLMLFFFVLAIMAGFFGTPAGNRNFGIIFVWIVWWALPSLCWCHFLDGCGVPSAPFPAPASGCSDAGSFGAFPVARALSAGAGLAAGATSGCKISASWRWPFLAPLCSPAQ